MGLEQATVVVPVKKLNLLHLSDIHFRKDENPATRTLNSDLRSQLEKVVVGLVSDVGHIHGILISGDVAFKGHPDEYQEGYKWILHICGLINCPPQNVWVVPGNHDVDQSFIENTPLFQALQKTLSDVRLEKLDEELTKQLAAKEAEAIVFGSIKNFNQLLASKFDCHFSSSRPYWEHRVKLNDGSDLVIRGLNSTLVSNKEDHENTHKMVVGASHCALKEENGATYLVMCHHPPDWLRDTREVTGFLDNRAAIQLFGHKHDQKEEFSNNITLKIFAGAVHPTRSEHPFEPRFNCLSVWVISEQTNTEQHQRFLSVEIRPWLWKDRFKQFQKESGRNGEYPIPFKIKIGKFDAVDQVAKKEEERLFEPATAPTRSDPLEIMSKMSNETEKKTSSYNAPRRLAFRFLSLPHLQRLEILTVLGLMENQDEGISDAELFKRIYKRAHEKGLLRKLWHDVETRQPDPETESNPFE